METLTTSGDRPIVVVLGTRPEIIKCAPVVEAFRRQTSESIIVVSTGQQRDLSRQTFSAVGLAPDADLDLMSANQSPDAFLARALLALGPELKKLNPKGVFVQGDTTSALAGALSAFHARIPVTHLEAGLRTYDLSSPFPEEMNRTLIGRIASVHFCPTTRARENLLREGITTGVHVVGNTVVDAVELVSRKLDNHELAPDASVLNRTRGDAPVVLVTCHRRDNIGAPTIALCRAIERLCQHFPNLTVVLPIHHNPNVRRVIERELRGHQQVFLSEPLDYATFVYAIKRSHLIISDSGGVQEEAPSLGTRVLVIRESSERPEGIEAGTSILCPLDNPDLLVHHAIALLEKPKPVRLKNPFGDGNSATRVIEILANM